MIIDGLIEPNEDEKYLLNLRKRKPFNKWDKEEHKEVCRKGQKALAELHGERKTAKHALQNILTLKVTPQIIADADIDESIAERLKRDNPNATLYDLIQAVAVGRALEGNVKAMEYVRDTHGDKPIERVEVSDNVTTEQDRELMQQIAKRLESAEITVVKDITDDWSRGYVFVKVIFRAHMGNARKPLNHGLSRAYAHMMHSYIIAIFCNDARIF